MMAVSAKGFQVAGISRAWAIVRPEPGKEGLLAWMIREDGGDVYRPMLLTPRGNGALVSAPMYQGYMFVRPLLERRRALLDHVYVAGVLGWVLFDGLVERIRAYEAEHNNVIQAEKTSLSKAKGPQVLRCLADLGKVETMQAIDTKNLDKLFEQLGCTSGRYAGTLETYVSTVDLPDQGEQQCGSRSRVRRFVL